MNKLDENQAPNVPGGGGENKTPGIGLRREVQIRARKKSIVQAEWIAEY